MLSAIAQRYSHLAWERLLTSGVDWIDGRHDHSSLKASETHDRELYRVGEADSDGLAIAQAEHWLQSDGQSSTTIAQLRIADRPFSDPINLQSTESQIICVLETVFTHQRRFMAPLTQIVPHVLIDAEVWIMQSRMRWLNDNIVLIIRQMMLEKWFARCWNAARCEPLTSSRLSQQLLANRIYRRSRQHHFPTSFERLRA